MPSPETKTIYQDQECKFDVPADGCRVAFGHKDQSQIIMDWRKDHFYLCDVRQGRLSDRMITVDIPIEVMAKYWPEVVKFFQDKVAEDTGGK